MVTGFAMWSVTALKASIKLDGGYMQDLYRIIAKLEKQTVDRHNGLVGHVNQLHQHQAMQLQNKQIDVLKEILTHAYSKAAAYTNVIIIAGYAAFFTLWNSMDGKLPAKPMFAAAICISLSVIIFILFEVYKMIKSSLYFRMLGKEFEKVQKPDIVIAKFQAEGQKFDQKMSMIWIYVLIPTLALGLTGAGILIYQFALKLLAN